MLLQAGTEIGLCNDDRYLSSMPYLRVAWLLWPSSLSQPNSALCAQLPKHKAPVSHPAGVWDGKFTSCEPEFGMSWAQGNGMAQGRGAQCPAQRFPAQLPLQPAGASVRIRRRCSAVVAPAPQHELTMPPSWVMGAAFWESVGAKTTWSGAQSYPYPCAEGDATVRARRSSNLVKWQTGCRVTA